MCAEDNGNMEFCIFFLYMLGTLVWICTQITQAWVDANLCAYIILNIKPPSSSEISLVFVFIYSIYACFRPCSQKRAMLICDFIYASLFVPRHTHPPFPNFLLYYLSWMHMHKDGHSLDDLRSWKHCFPFKFWHDTP